MISKIKGHLEADRPGRSGTSVALGGLGGRAKGAPAGQALSRSPGQPQRLANNEE